MNYNNLILTMIKCNLHKIYDIHVFLQNGLYSSIPQLAKFIMMLVFGALGDYIVRKQICHINVLRKVMQSIGKSYPAWFRVLAGYHKNILVKSVDFVISHIISQFAYLCLTVIRYQ